MFTGFYVVMLSHIFQNIFYFYTSRFGSSCRVFSEAFLGKSFGITEKNPGKNLRKILQTYGRNLERSFSKNPDKIGTSRKTVLKVSPSENANEI